MLLLLLIGAGPQPDPPPTPTDVRGTINNVDSGPSVAVETRGAAATVQTISGGVSVGDQ